MGIWECINVSTSYQTHFGLRGLRTFCRRARIEQLEKEGELDGTGDSLGAGGFWAWEPKTFVCYYKTDTGDVGIACCRDGGTIRLPWNPLAKWC